MPPYWLTYGEPCHLPVIVQILLYLQAYESIVVEICDDECRSHEDEDLIMRRVNFLNVYVSWLQVKFFYLKF